MSDEKTRLFYLGPPAPPTTPPHPVVDTLETLAKKFAPVAPRLGGLIPYSGRIENGVETLAYYREKGLLVRNSFEQRGEVLNGARIYLWHKGWLVVGREGREANGVGQWIATRQEVDARTVLWWLGGVRGALDAVKALSAELSQRPSLDVQSVAVVRWLKLNLRRSLQ